MEETNMKKVYIMLFKAINIKLFALITNTFTEYL